MAVTSERVVRVITKQVRVSSRMSQSAVALDHLRTCVLCGSTHASFAQHQQHLAAALLRAGDRAGSGTFALCDITCACTCTCAHAHVHAHVDSAVLWT